MRGDHRRPAAPPPEREKAAPARPPAGPALRAERLSAAGEQADRSRELPFLDRCRGAEPERELERIVRRHAHAGEKRRLALGVAAGLRLAQLHHQVEECGRLVAFKRHNEFLVIEAEGIGGVELYLGIPWTDRARLAPHRLASLLAEAIPYPPFPHWNGPT